MSSTGIVRKIDDLGRVVIPKEIRKYIGIKDGDSLEIFINKGEIILRKYNASMGLSELVRELDNEFSHVKNDMETETANKIYEHINALREILNGVRFEERFSDRSL